MAELSLFIERFGILTFIIVALIFVLVRVITANNMRVSALTDRTEADTKKDETISALATSSFNELLKFTNTSITLARELGHQEKMTALLEERMFAFDAQLRGMEVELKNTRIARAADTEELAQLKKTLTQYLQEKSRLAQENTSLSEELNAIKQKNIDLKAQVDILTLRVTAQEIEIESIRQGTAVVSAAVVSAAVADIDPDCIEEAKV